MAVLLLLLLPRLGPAQDSVAAGDRVRIWSQTDLRYHARVLASWYPDSLRLLRSDSAWRAAATRTVQVDLKSVEHLDLAQGNRWLTGALGGVGVALAAGIVVAIAAPDNGDLAAGEKMLLYSGLGLAVTVPVGALIGSSYPRWHRIR